VFEEQRAILLSNQLPDARRGAARSLLRSPPEAQASGGPSTSDPPLGAIASSADDARREFTPQMMLRPYQQDAVAAAEAGLAQPGTRGQLHHACGTGKTVTAIAVAEQLCPPGGLVVMTCPTLDLIDQSLGKWLEIMQRPVAILAVAGDDGVVDAAVRVADLPCPVTTDPATIAYWLSQAGNDGSIRLVLSTAVSSHRVGEALLAADTTADLLIVDEAHETAGVLGKHTALLHDDRRLPAARRLYLTATPRLSAASRSGNGEPLISMDGPEFGPVLHSYPFSAAERDGWLDPYQLAVIGVRRQEVLDALQRVDPKAATDAFSPTLRSMAVQVALAQAARQWDLRRVVAFCPRIVDAEAFARSLPRTIRALEPERRPKGSLHSMWLSGLQSPEQRRIELGRLREPPEGGWTMLSNARVLARGVDVPAIDCVVFTHPKRSTVEIVQAVGRAVRPHPEGRRTAIILVPILLPDDPHELTDVGDTAEFEVLWQVVRALRAHDDALAAELDGQRSHYGAFYSTELPEKFLIQLPPGFGETWVNDLTTRIVRAATSEWWDGAAIARAYHDRHGNLRVPKGFVTDDTYPTADYALGLWIQSQRRRRRGRQLREDQIAALEALDMIWEPRDADWWANFDRAVAYHRERGGSGPLDVSKADDPALASWLNRQRQRRDGLKPAMVNALDTHGYDWRDKEERAFARGLAAAQSYYNRHGHLVVPTQHSVDGLDLGDWLSRLRRKYHNGLLPDSWREALENLGIDWSPQKGGYRPRRTQGQR
jgi:superfamily II DNA or RNA helicase